MTSDETLFVTLHVKPPANVGGKWGYKSGVVVAADAQSVTLEIERYDAWTLKTTVLNARFPRNRIMGSSKPLPDIFPIA